MGSFSFEGAALAFYKIGRSERVEKIDKIERSERTEIFLPPSQS